MLLAEVIGECDGCDDSMSGAITAVAAGAQKIEQIGPKPEYGAVVTAINNLAKTTGTTWTTPSKGPTGQYINTYTFTTARLAAARAQVPTTAKGAINTRNAITKITKFTDFAKLAKKLGFANQVNALASVAVRGAGAVPAPSTCPAINFSADILRLQLTLIEAGKRGLIDAAVNPTKISGFTDGRLGPATLKALYGAVQHIPTLRTLLPALPTSAAAQAVFTQPPSKLCAFYTQIYNLRAKLYMTIRATYTAPLPPMRPPSPTISTPPAIQQMPTPVVPTPMGPLVPMNGSCQRGYFLYRQGCMSPTGFVPADPNNPGSCIPSTMSTPPTISCPVPPNIGVNPPIACLKPPCTLNPVGPGPVIVETPPETPTVACEGGQVYLSTAKQCACPPELPQWYTDTKTCGAEVQVTTPSIEDSPSGYPPGTIYRHNLRRRVYVIYVPTEESAPFLSEEVKTAATFGYTVMALGEVVPPAGTVKVAESATKPVDPNATDGGTEDVPWYLNWMVLTAVGVAAAGTAVYFVRRKKLAAPAW